MSQKSEIKVYLPTKLVGRLEEKKKAGIRSKFIKDAIIARLDKESEYDLWDINDAEIFDEAVSRLRRLDGTNFESTLAYLLRRIYQ